MTDPLEAVLSHLSVHDPTMAQLLVLAQSSEKPLSIPSKRTPDQYVTALYESIVSQQLSVKASDTIWKRFEALVGDPSDPKRILAFELEQFRSIGLSWQKAGYITSIAEHIDSGKVNIDHLDELSDEEVVAELTQIKGIGQWTAEMFLIFSLGRPDVFSAGDLGLHNAVKKHYDRPDITKAELLAMSTVWSPHRSIASLTLWHSLDNQPKL